MQWDAALPDEVLHVQDCGLLQRQYLPACTQVSCAPHNVHNTTIDSARIVVTPAPVADYCRVYDLHTQLLGVPHICPLTAIFTRAYEHAAGKAICLSMWRRGAELSGHHCLASCTTTPDASTKRRLSACAGLCQEERLQLQLCQAKQMCQCSPPSQQLLLSS